MKASDTWNIEVEGARMSKTVAKTEQSRFLRVEDMAEMLQCSESHAYKVMRELNNELKKKGKIVVAGRISRRYVEERLY